MKRISRILFVLLFIVSVIVDCVNGYMQTFMGLHTDVGFLLRGTIMLICIPSLIKHPILKKALIPFIFIYVLSLCIWIINNPSVEISVEISKLSKYLYVYFLFAFFYIHWQQLSYKQLLNYISNYATIIAIVLILCYTFNFGISSYGAGNYGWGTQGLFIAGNDLGLTLVLSLIMSCLLYVKFEPTILLLSKIVIIAIGSVLIGTRTCFIMIPLIMISFIIYLAMGGGKKRRYVLSFFLIVLLVYFVPRFVVSIYEQFDTYAMNRLTLESLENARTSFTEPAKQYIASFSGPSYIIGNGYTLYLRWIGADIGIESKSAEADIYDVIGPYGYVFGTVFLLFYISCFLTSIASYFKKKGRDELIYMFAIFVFTGISILSGHALNNVLVAPIFAIIATRVYKKYDCNGNDVKIVIKKNL